MSFATGLRCRECGEVYPLDPIQACQVCWGPLEVVYDYKALLTRTCPAAIAAGPPSLWRYEALLPASRNPAADLGAGFTPLIEARNLGRVLGLSRLYLKNDCVNPSHSFKDRVVAVATAKALEFGFRTLACASTGNLAGAVAAQAARAGMEAYVFVPADLERNKLVAAVAYGAHLVAVKGNYDQVNRLVSEVAERFDWAFVNVNMRAYYTEGSKTLAFEVVEQLGWQAPDHVVVPIASGALLTKIGKGLRELLEVGLVREVATRIHGAQAHGCSPVAQAFAEGSADVRPVKPNTIARSLAIGSPADGVYALRTVRESGGQVVAVSDDEIVAGMRLLASTEGIFGETAAGTTIAVLRRLAQGGFIKADDLTVAYVTGSGLKTPDALVGTLESATVVEPRVEAFAQAVGAAA